MQVPEATPNPLKQNLQKSGKIFLQVPPGHSYFRKAGFPFFFFKCRYLLEIHCNGGGGDVAAGGTRVNWCFEHSGSDASSTENHCWPSSILDPINTLIKKAKLQLGFVMTISIRFSPFWVRYVCHHYHLYHHYLKTKHNKNKQNLCFWNGPVGTGPHMALSTTHQNWSGCCPTLQMRK